MFFTKFWVWGFFNTVFYFPKMVTLGCLNTSVFVFLYLRELLMSNKILNYKKHLPFWISIGFLIFYLPAIPFFTMQEYMVGRNLFFIISILIDNNTIESGVYNIADYTSLSTKELVTIIGKNIGKTSLIFATKVFDKFGCKNWRFFTIAN